LTPTSLLYKTTKKTQRKSSPSKELLDTLLKPLHVKTFAFFQTFGNSSVMNQPINTANCHGKIKLLAKLAK